MQDRTALLIGQAGVERLAAERMHLYHEWADVILRCTGSAQSDAELVKDLLRL